MHIFKKSKIEKKKKIEQQSVKNHMFLGASILEGFWKVLKGFWEAKILDFRIFFDVFSTRILKSASKSEKSSKNRSKTDQKAHETHWHSAGDPSFFAPNLPKGSKILEK